MTGDESVDHNRFFDALMFHSDLANEIQSGMMKNPERLVLCSMSWRISADYWPVWNRTTANAV
jgi:hypothetical protein